MRWLYAASNAALSVPGSRAATKSPSVGTPCGRPPLAAFHRSDRTSAFGQCANACSTVTTITVAGSLPLTAKRRLRSTSALIRARPFVGLVHTGHEEDQPNARVLNKIPE